MVPKIWEPKVREEKKSNQLSLCVCRLVYYQLMARVVQQVIRQSQAGIEMNFKRKIEISPSSPVIVKSAKSSANERSCFAFKIMLS